MNAPKSRVDMNRASLFALTLVFGAACGLAVVGGSGCDRGSTAEKETPADPSTLMSDAGTFTRADVLASLGNCALEMYRRSATASTALAAAIARHQTEASEGSLRATREAFAKTMFELQQAELAQFGPFGRTSTPGGDNIRDQVYAWPATSPCLVDETIVSRGYEAPDFTT